MRKFILFLFSLAIGIVLFEWVVSSVGWEKVRSAFENFSLKAGLVILFLTFLSVIIRSLRWKTILKSQQCDIPFVKACEYYLSGLSIAFFFPMVIFGGEVFRGYDLKEKYSIPWSKSIASVIIDRISEITIYTVAVILGMVFFLLKANFIPEKFFMIVFGGAFLTLAFMGLFYFKTFRKEGVITSLFKILRLENSNGIETVVDVEKEILNYFRPNKKEMWEGIALSLLHELTLLARAAFLLFFLGKGASFFTIVSVVAFSSLAVMIPIPAALGSHEAVQSFIFDSLGLGADTAMAFVFIVRGAELTIVLIGAFFFLKLGFQILNSLIIKKISKLISKK